MKPFNLHVMSINVYVIWCPAQELYAGWPCRLHKPEDMVLSVQTFSLAQIRFIWAAAAATTASRGLLSCWKHLLFLSFQIIHLQTTILSMTRLEHRRFWLTCESHGTTSRGVASKPSLVDRLAHPILTKSQSQKRWLKSSWAELHSTQVVSTWIPLLISLSFVSSLPLVNNQKKNFIFGGSLFSHIYEHHGSRTPGSTKKA